MSLSIHNQIAADGQRPADGAPDRLAAWSLLAGLVLFAAMAGPFFAGRIYTADDLGAFHLPTRAFYAEQLARGQPYDWMPCLFSGFYLTGEGQTGSYHPLHQILYRFLSLRAALGWEYLLPYPLMMLGMWLWLKRRLGRSDAAMLGGLVFAFSSFNLLHFVHPNAIAVVAHIPWLLWAIDVAMTDSRRWRVGLALTLIALLTGSQLLLGYPQYVWFSLVAECSYVLFLPTALRTWSPVVVAKGVGLLIGGIQLLPSLDAWQNSARLSANGSFPFWGSLHPLNLLQLVAPYLFVGRVIGDNTHEFGLYLGAVPLLLGAWVIARRRELGSLAPLAWAALVFGLLTLFLSFGQHGFLYEITTWLPLVWNFRFPCRYLVLFQLAAAGLAAIGFLLLLRESERARQQRTQGIFPTDRSWRSQWRGCEPLWYIVGLSAVVAVAGMTFGAEHCVDSIALILAGPVLLATAAALMTVAAHGRPAALVGLILLAAMDMGCYGLSHSTYLKSACLEQFVASAQTPPGKPDGRVLASLFRTDEPGLRTGDLMTLAGWRRVDGYAGLEPRRRLDYGLLPALQVAGVRWVRQNPSTEDIAGMQPYDDLWRQAPGPLPRVRLVTQTHATNDPARDILRICPETTALCEVPLGLPASRPGTAVLEAERPGRLEIQVDCPAGQLLVLAEAYHDGWRATVDGVPRKVYRINGDFMGCTVGPGKNRVVFNFQPDSLQRGRLTSWLGLCLTPLCFLIVLGRPKSTIQKN